MADPRGALRLILLPLIIGNIQPDLMGCEFVFRDYLGLSLKDNAGSRNRSLTEVRTAPAGICPALRTRLA
jgi:hypothetical protein